MEKKTEDYLQQIDWDRIRQKRIQNFQILHSRLKFINQAEVDFESKTPYMYPLLVEQKDLRTHLIENKIFVSKWWRDVLQQNASSEHERRWAEYLIPLPIDQRYSEKDMEHIARTVLSERVENHGKEIVSNG